MAEEYVNPDDLIRMSDVPMLVLEMTGLHRGEDTVRKWARDGVIGYNGERLKLKYVRRLKTHFTTKKWVEEFLRKV